MHLTGQLGPGLITVTDGRGDADGREVVGGEPIVAGRDTPEVFEATEHALDRIAASVESRREAILPAPVGFGRDVGHRTGGLDLATNGVAVVALVGVQDAASGHPL